MPGFSLELNDVRLPDGEPFAHTFRAGEITVVLGPNRSGKTDLCRFVAGLATATTGVCALDQKARQAGAAMVYQAFVNYPNLTVAQNIASPLGARRRAGTDVAVARYARMLKIEDLLQRYPHELSGGQQQRVAIARALAKEAPVLLLDEPLVNLDFKLREDLENELRSLLRERNTVVIYTSSDPREAFSMADELLLLDQGRLLQAGTPLQVYDAPASLAAMDLLSDPQVNTCTRDGGTLALRPEHLRPGGDKVHPDETLHFDMQVTSAETNGAQTYVHGEVEGRDWVVRVPGLVTLTPGTALPLSARAGDARLFPVVA